VADKHFLFFDGSSLISQIRQLQEQQGVYKGHLLDPIRLVQQFTRSSSVRDIIGTGYKRAVFYFADGDASVEKFLQIPDRTQPGLVRDIEFRFCGEKLPHSKKLDEFIESVPDEFRDRFTKSEKGVDIEICCDALQLTATGNLERLFLLTNDSDFLPLCRKIKEFGANISLLRLSTARPVNKDLVELCDSFDIVNESSLPYVFNLPSEAVAKK